jgi:hypothetical protein
MSQPLKDAFHNDLQKCPVENRTRQVIAGFATETLLVHRVAFANAVSVRLYPNNVVLVQTGSIR